MRRLVIIIAAGLLAVGLVLLFLGRNEPSASSGSEQAADASQTPASARSRPGRPQDLGAGSRAELGSTPSLEQAPSEKDGVLEVEVMAGEQPVAEAHVRLYWRGALDPDLGEVSWRLASSGLTDARGLVRLPSRPGGYLLAVHADGYAALQRTVVRPSGEARTRLRLTLQRGLALTGRTGVQGSGEPLPMVELVLTAHGNTFNPWERPVAPAEERAHASSDERGNFRIEGLAPGEYMLEARALGYARTVLKSVRVPAQGPLTVALQAAATVEGFIVDAQGHPVADAEVQASGRGIQVTTTGQGGGFSLEVEPGTYALSARRGDEAGLLERALSVAAGETVKDVTIRLGRGATLEGRVVAVSSRAPVAGATVDVGRAGGFEEPVRRTTTDGAGHFAIEGLVAGSYELTVSAPGFASEFLQRLAVASGDRSSVEIQLTGTGAVEGQVKDESGKPLPGMQVSGGIVWGGGQARMPAVATTDSKGRYRIEGLDPGRRELTLNQEGVALGEVQVAYVKEGQTQRVDFTVKGTGTLEGVVRSLEGRLPVESLEVELLRAEAMAGDRFARTDLDASAHFRVEVPAGTYQLHAAPKDPTKSPYMLKEARVEAGKTTQVELEWEDLDASFSAEKIQGIVLEPGGAPSAGASVMVALGPQSRGATVLADDQGHFSHELPPREGNTSVDLRLVATNGGRRGELLARLGDAKEFVVKLQPAASVRGQVVRASGGTPVQGFSLSVQPREEVRFREMDAREFPGDRFELNDLPAEPLKLVVRTRDGAVGETQVSLAPGASAEVRVVLKAAAGLQGRLVDDVTREPVWRMLVLLFPKDQEPSDRDPPVSQSPDGRIRAQGVSPGEYTLVIRRRDTQLEVRRPVTVAEGQVLDLGDIPISQPRPTPSPPPP